LQYHLSDQKTLERIRKGNWDYVVIQEQSQMPALGGKHEKAFHRSVDRFTRIIREAGSEPILFMTWGRRDGDRDHKEIFPDYETMQKRLSSAYIAAARRNQIPMAPVGDAWSAVRQRDAKLGNALYFGDGSHPSAYGAYLTSCVFFWGLFPGSLESLGRPKALTKKEYKIFKEAILSLYPADGEQAASKRKYVQGLRTAVGAFTTPIRSKYIAVAVIVAAVLLGAMVILKRRSSSYADVVQRAGAETASTRQTPLLRAKSHNGEPLAPIITDDIKCHTRSHKQTMESRKTVVPIKFGLIVFAALMIVGIRDRVKGTDIIKRLYQYTDRSSDIIAVQVVSFPETVYLKDEQAIEGEIVQIAADEITVNSQGVESTVPMEEVEGLTLKINPLIELDYVTKGQVYSLRKAFVASYPYLYDASDYEPLDVIFREIEDGKPWAGMLGLAYYGGGEQSNEGLSDESRFIANPFLLIGLTEGYLFTVEDKSLPPMAFYPRPSQLYWNMDWSFASAKYDVSSYFELAQTYYKNHKDYHTFGITYYNARDFGFNYMYLDRSRSHNVRYDGPANEPLPLIQYIHCAGHSWFHPQGVNNMSPPQEGTSVQIWKLPARMHIKLWKEKPASVDSDADLDFVIEAE